ncbi:MAG: sialidase family protein [Planctomycetota bacterium]|jgi:hypothetical protein
MEIGRSYPALALCAFIVPMGTANGAGPVTAPPRRPAAPVVLERPGDPYRPVFEGAGVAGVPGTAAFGDFVSIQVNVNDLGGNIFGDAGNEPSIAVDPTAPNRIAIGWRQFDTISSNFREAGYSYSRDGGRTWAGKSEIDSGLFRSDPVLGAAPDGTFYYSSLRIDPSWAVDMFRSFDGGATWPVSSFAFGGDKQWFAIDDTGGPGHGHIYQGWNVAGNDYFPNQFSRSPDFGVTWENPVEYDPVEEFAQPVFGLTTVGPDGSVYVAGTRNDGSNDTFWVVRSSNAQFAAQTPTFDQITLIDMGGSLELGEAPNPAGLLGQVNIDVDESGGPFHGRVYVLASINPPGPDPLDVHLIYSDDNGVTFTSPIRINDDPFFTSVWQWFGQMSVAPNGRIDVVWNDTRNSGVDNISQLFYSFSTDGGATWSVNEPISGSFNSHLGWPQQNKLGDYYHLKSDKVGAHLAWAATFNFEQDVYYLRIGEYDCNDNGVPDPDDIANETSGDCNANDIPDECEIAAGTVTDDNGNGIPDECEGCPWDCGDPPDGVVNVIDFLTLLAQWGQVGASCDFDGDGVSVNDFLAQLANWGSCP